MKRRLALGLALTLAGCGGDDGGSGDSPDGGGDPGAPFIVELTTTAGTITIDVNPEWSPNGAARFRELVEAGFYDGNRFFRVIPGFVVQFGINGEPAVNSMWSSRTITDDPVLESNLRGFVTFAMTGNPNSRTTQLFINYGDNSFLDDMGFSPFGVVTSGMDNADAINDEYGEVPSQERIASEGNAYLDESFPNLDVITTARIIP